MSVLKTTLESKYNYLHFTDMETKAQRCREFALCHIATNGQNQDLNSMKPVLCPVNHTVTTLVVGADYYHIGNILVLP